MDILPLVIILVSVAIILIPEYFEYRLKMRSSHDFSTEEMADLRERLDATEKRCVKLEAQIVDLHVQLADETRQLDKKLSSMLPDSSSEPPDARDDPARQPRERALN